MTKTELIATVAEKTGLNKTEVEAALNAITDAIIDADKVTIKGFGNFKWKRREARTGRNPKTGEPVEIQASETLHFKPSNLLKQL